MWLYGLETDQVYKINKSMAISSTYIYVTDYKMIFLILRGNQYESHKYFQHIHAW